MGINLMRRCILVERGSQMITCTLGEKKYSVDFVSGRALREMEPALKMYGRLMRISQDAVEGREVSDKQLTIAVR